MKTLKLERKIFEFAMKHNLKLESTIENNGGKPSLVFIDGDYKHEGYYKESASPFLIKENRFSFTGKTYTLINGVPNNADYEISGYRFLKYSSGEVVQDRTADFSNEEQYLKLKKITFKPEE